ncbi:MAG TPA: alpha/beta hydrolase [Catenuloplanes sp.]
MAQANRLMAVVLTTAALLLPASAAVAAPTAADAAGGRHPAHARIAWAPCPQDATADCGTLKVPVNWARPHGPTFELALARRKATNPAARIGSLVINPGGPGGSGVGTVLGRQRFTKQLTERFDIVGFDPRGVGASNPVMCSSELLDAAPNRLLKSQAEFDRLAAYNRRLAADCRARTGPVFDHVDTVSVVHDIDAIRAALGDRKLSFFGVSYGTLMAQQYAELYPHRVRALVLDSNMDHSLGTRAFLDTESATAQDSFNEFVAGCARDERCALHGRDIRAFWANLLARADRGELAGGEIGSLDLIGLTVGSFYGPNWLGLAEFLVALDTGVPPSEEQKRAVGADTMPGVVAKAKAWRQPAAPEEPTPDATHNPFAAVFCQDWAVPVRDYRDFARHLERQRRIAPDVRFSPLALTAVTSCIGWPGRVNNPQHRLRVSPVSPTLLMVNALHDPATAYQWAVNAARQIGREAVLLTYEGWGHGVYGREPCATGAIDRYLVAGTLPARGTRCAGVLPQPPAEPGRRAAAPERPPGPGPNIPGWFWGACRGGSERSQLAGPG